MRIIKVVLIMLLLTQVAQAGQGKMWAGLGVALAGVAMVADGMELKNTTYNPRWSYDRIHIGGGNTMVTGIYEWRWNDHGYWDREPKDQAEAAFGLMCVIVGSVAFARNAPEPSVQVSITPNSATARISRRF